MDKNTFFELAAKILAGEASAAEQKTFNTYLRNKEYRNLYEGLQEAWQKELTYESDEFELERGLRKLRSKINDAANVSARKKARILRLKQPLRIAAGLLILIGISVFVYRLREYQAPKPPVDMVTITAQRGERKTVKLPDGSTTTLNAGATIWYPVNFPEDSREIRLSGEAFFEVTTDTRKPFLVRSGEFETTVLGTSFAINQTDQRFFVTVETGRVRVNKVGKPEEIILEKGQQGTFHHANNRFRKSEVATERYIAWKDNILRFDEITIGEAFNKIENWYNVTIQCDSEALLNRRIKATYQNESLQHVMDDLAFMTDITYQYQNADTLIIH